MSLPSCATSCIALPSSCNMDTTCICTDSSWLSDVYCCVFKSCDTADQQAAINYAQTLCTPVGVSLPGQASCAASSSSSSSTTTTTTSSSSSSSTIDSNLITASDGSLASGASSAATDGYQTSVGPSSASSFTTSLSSRVSLISQTPTAAPASTSSSAATGFPVAGSEHSESLSTGALVGISVGCTIASIAIIALLIFYIRRHIQVSWKSHHEADDARRAVRTSWGRSKAELSGEKGPTVTTQSANGSNRGGQELFGHGNRGEVMTEANRHEMSATLNRPWSQEYPAELPGYYDKI